MPTTSPAKASSATERSWAKKNCGLASGMLLPVRTSLAFMPRLSFPEHSRAKAMRSRWFGSMLAWILNTKALMRGSAASHLAQVGILRARRGCELAEPFEQIADAEIAQRAAEIDRRQMALAECLQLERLAGLAHQLQLVLDRRRHRDWRCWRAELGDVDLLGPPGLGAAAFEQAHAAVERRHRCP